MATNSNEKNISRGGDRNFYDHSNNQLITATNGSSTSNEYVWFHLAFISSKFLKELKSIHLIGIFEFFCY